MEVDSKTGATQGNWDRVQEVFGHVVDLPEPEWEDALLRATDAPLIRDEVRSLLDSFRSEPDFLEKPPLEKFFREIHLKGSDSFEPGDTLGDFRILRRLDAGAFATVYLGEQLSLNRQVALKVSPDVGTEARTMASLEHEHIVKVFQQTVLDEHKLRVLCMQYIPGTTLQRVLETAAGDELSGKRLLQIVDALQSGEVVYDPAAAKDREYLESLDASETAAWFGMKLAQALDYAHERGVLHLDVKPANILINRYGRPLLTDFNVAVRSPAKDSKLPVEILGGTLDYMAPEHLRIFKASRGTEKIDHRADVYSLGLVMKEMAKTTLSKTENSAFSLKPILDFSTRENPRHRFGSAAHFCRALEGFLELRSIHRALPRAGWVTRLTQEYPLSTLAVCSFLPQVLGSVVSICYNALWIGRALTPAQHELFRLLCVIYNLAVYPTCVGLVFWALLPIAKFLRTPQMPFEHPDEVHATRHHLLNLPFQLMGIGFLGWMPGSIFFPLMLHWLEGPLMKGVGSHFFISFSLSCLIAVTYSFLFVQFLGVRVLFPRLCVGEANVRRVASYELGSMGFIQHLFHFSAGFLPLVAMALLLILRQQPAEQLDKGAYRALLLFLVALSAVGIAFAIRATHLISETLVALTGKSRSQLAQMEFAP